ncbi:MAG TPA: MiaB/RimO family radical SAM methylthiotransferase [Spirochaetota bacterium]|nr:MiaB/RimO family radical SAM methylthiotransferase [Spirochaetota bacterium]HPC40232.1 MiaB/RimO family radical SAM methylthiotransferase [Spirochaetota bacterium]HQF07293.1 MiaB/RimO family radical SAM methylthiotransferase [Spirochaetota bacterium]HQH96194.1 MiaB/RimO family radical SAM methylthiotransferase [Spirochaetota bacterium]
MKIKISSLGCRLNQSEIQSVSTALQDMGHEIARGDDADVFIINSCAVTQRSEGKTRRLVHHAAEAARGRAGAKIIVTGCIADAPSRQGNTYYLPNDYKFMIPDLVANWDLFEEISPPPDARFRFTPPLKSSTSRVNLKIQDGCGNFCSYCIVPLVRGPSQSKPADLVADEFRRMIEAGFREIILAGVMIGNYRDGGTGLAGLVRRLLSVEGRFRLHLTSLMPVYVTPELIDLFHSEKIVKHLHLSLQSGSNAVLALMNRPYTREDYLTLAGMIRSAVPDFNFTTDVIVGFPGETETDFLDTLGLIRDVGFSHVHTFRYSPRPGTKAAAMEDTVSEAEKKERSGQVIELSTALKQQYYRRFNGRESLFLSERCRGAITTGFNEYYAPVEVADKLPRNEFFSVTTRLEEGKQSLSGTVLPDKYGILP